MSLSKLNVQGIRALFETFRLALLVPAFCNPGDPAKYAIRGRRNKPKQPYPKPAKNATYITLDTSCTNFDSWEISEDTGAIKELELNGPKGLRQALATVWDRTT
jgi:hypothetical protein